MGNLIVPLWLLGGSGWSAGPRITEVGRSVSSNSYWYNRKNAGIRGDFVM